MTTQKKSSPIVIAGKQADIPAILTNVLAINQIIREKDIGQFVGMALSDAVKKPALEPTHLTIYFSDLPDRINPRGTRPHYKVPFVKRTVTWEQVRVAGGGKNGYQWGRFFAVGTIQHDNMNARMRIHGASKDVAINRLEKLVELSHGKLLGINAGEEEKIGEKADGKAKKKETTQVYPIYFSITNPQRVANRLAKEKQGFPLLNGEAYNFRRNKFYLYFDSPPSYYKEELNELLKPTDED